MRGVPVVVFVLLATGFATLCTPAALASPGSGPEPPGVSYVVFLKDQRSHEASLAVRAALSPAVDALADQRAALVRSPADLMAPNVQEINRRIDEAIGIMRLEIATAATGLHAPSRTVVESFVADLGGTVTYRSPLLNLLVVRVPEDRAHALRSHALVASVEREGVMDVLLDVSVPAIGASSFWTGGPFTGGPFKIIVPDTGVDPDHPAYAGQISDAQVFHDAAQMQGNYGDNPATPDDLHGHGTHIAGIVTSQDSTYQGVAYGMLGVVNVKFGYLTSSGGGQGVWSDAWKGIDWSVFVAGGDVLTFSYGGGNDNDGTDAMSLFMDALVDDLGIPVSAAAGNSGPGGSSIIQPATAYNLMTVGAIDDRNTVARSDDTIAGFSSRGPTGDGRVKPDIVAPGSDIISTAHNWEGGGSGNDWVSMGGTSMASPHVGASLLLFLQSAGGPPMFPARAKAVLLNTAEDKGTGGPDMTYGWGYLDVATVWAQRNNVVEGIVAPGAAAFYRVTSTIGDRATLVWQKHLIYNYAGQPNPSAWTRWSLNNVDLGLYAEASQNRLTQSISPRDNVEQVVNPSGGVTSNILKVFTPGALQGVAQEPFALAARTALTPMGPPALSVVVTAPPTANSGVSFVVDVDVTNTGQLGLGTSTVLLALPPGVILIGGANPAMLGPIPAGTTRSTSWTVSTTVIGTHDFNVGAAGTAYEESFSGSGGPARVTVLDTMPPTIAAASALPNPQNVGASVNVSALITDNVAVTGAWVRVWDPVGVLLGNFSMPLDLFTGRRYYTRPYPTIGVHDYRMSAVDAAVNWAVAVGQFEIADLEAPVLSGVLPIPNPQEVFFSVNVTGTATDNVGVTGAFLEVRDPLGATTNATMAIAGSTVSLERTYDVVGAHTFRVSVHDAAGNWDDYGGAFMIQDATDPIAVAGPDQTVEAGTLVSFDGSLSSDNVGIVSHVWTFDDGGLWTLPGVSADHTFNAVGVFVVTLTVMDAAGNPGTDTLTVTVQDPRPPVIEDVRADPPLQDVGGIVAVSAKVTDDFGIAGVWLYLTDPAGGTSNGTMAPGGDVYATASPHTLKGLYVFEIWASDMNGNWASARGGFWIADLTPPIVTATVAPDVEIFNTVTVSAVIVENDALGDVILEVRDPWGVATFLPMILAGTEWQASIAPDVLGPHALTVWAEDVSGNLGSADASVVSVDRTPPELDGEAPAMVEVLDPIPFTIEASDNLGTVLATLEVWDPTGASLGKRPLLGPSPVAVTTLASVLGTYTWTAHAVDPSGNEAFDQGIVESVDTHPPVADAGPDRTVVQGANVPFDGSGSTDNFAIAAYRWDFTVSDARGVRAAHAFPLPGTYSVVLTVTDLAGLADEDEAVVTVIGADSDGDGSWDDNETAAGTDPTLPDTDGDGLLDGSDPDPKVAAFDVTRIFASWLGVLILLLVFLMLVAGGVLRRRKSEPASAPSPAAPRPARPPVARIPSTAPPPPPEDQGLPPPPLD